MKYFIPLIFLCLIGCSPKQPDSLYIPPLSSLIFQEAPQAIIFEEMKKNPGNIDQLDWRGATALMYATGIHLNDPERDMLRDGAIKESKEKPAIVEELLANGANPSLFPTGSELSPLKLAIYHGRLESVKILLRFKADPNLIRDDGYTPLMLAAYRCYPDIAQVLLAHGAKVNHQSLSKETALKLAIENKCELVRKQLDTPNGATK